MQGDDRMAELTRRKRERFETSVHTLAVVALAKEAYPDDAERSRLLAEYASLIDAHETAIKAAKADRLPDTATNEEKSAQAERLHGPIRDGYRAMEAFGKTHPLIKTMQQQIEALTRSILY